MPGFFGVRQHGFLIVAFVVHQPGPMFDFCERSDRILRLILGSTPDQTVWRFGPLFILLVIGAVVAPIAGWLPR
jgi:hypothetical protein